MEEKLQILLKELQQREVDKLAVEVLKIKETIYPNLEEVITRTATLTGIPEETLVRACHRASWQYEHVDWRQILEIVKSFWLAKNQLEEKQASERE